MSRMMYVPEFITYLHGPKMFEHHHVRHQRQYRAVAAANVEGVGRNRNKKAKQIKIN